MNQNLKYRPELDTLRAFSVLAVIINHAFPKILSGGYIGVDVFFVLSGFLMQSILNQENKKPFKFIFSFYFRRLKRLFPAAITMIVIISVTSFWLLPTSEYIEALKAAKSSIFIFSNYHFANQDSYFSPDIQNNPFLHMWSLSLEEQFYIIMPIFLLCIFFIKKEYTSKFIFLLWILSLLYACLSSSNNSFFYLQTRAFEILTGSLIASPYFQKTTQDFSLKKQKILTIIGIIGIFSSFIFFVEDINSLHPGPLTLIPVFSTALYILYSRSFQINILKLKPLLFIGTISYSIYLWHQPILSFIRANTLEENNFILLSGLILSIIIGWISWKYVEQTFRQINSFKKNIIISIFITTIISSPFIFSYIIKISENNYHYQTYLKNADPEIIVDINKICSGKLRKNTDNFLKNCTFKGQDPKIAIIGDSHGVSLQASAILTEEFPAFLGGSMNQCGSFGINAKSKHKMRKDCPIKTENIIQEIIKNKNIETIIILNRWPLHIKGTIKNNEITTSTSIDKNKSLYDVIENLILSFKKANKKIIIIGSSPEYPWNIPKRIEKINKSPFLNKNKETSYDRSFYDIRSKDINKKLKEITERNSNTFFINPEQIFCNEKECFYRQITNSKKTETFYYDKDHIHPEKGKEIINQIIKLNIL